MDMGGKSIYRRFLGVENAAKVTGVEWKANFMSGMIKGHNLPRKALNSSCLLEWQRSFVCACQSENI